MAFQFLTCFKSFSVYHRSDSFIVHTVLPIPCLLTVHIVQSNIYSIHPLIVQVYTIPLSVQLYSSPAWPVTLEPSPDEIHFLNSCLSFQPQEDSNQLRRGTLVSWQPSRLRQDGQWSESVQAGGCCPAQQEQGGGQVHLDSDPWQGLWYHKVLGWGSIFKRNNLVIHKFDKCSILVERKSS